MNTRQEINLQLQDEEWPFTYTSHDRQITRAIVCDDKGYFYFVRAVRNDDFVDGTLIETAGGGVEEGEYLRSAIQRELIEELGARVEVLCKIGVVEDYYNLIHRHNINHYYLCKVVSFGEKHLTQDEVESFHLSTLKLTYDEAVLEYETCAMTKLGRLIANRELPVLRRAKEILDQMRDNITARSESEETVISRIKNMEFYLDEILTAFHSANVRDIAVDIKTISEIYEQNPLLKRHIDCLRDYYDSGLWLLDYELDERGELPTDLKRGVLAQDTLYNLFSDIDRISSKDI